MTNTATWDKLQLIFRDVMYDDSIVLSDSMSAVDVAGWDSVTHVMLIVEVEKQFGVKFNASEIPKLKNVGDLLRLIESKST